MVKDPGLRLVPWLSQVHTLTAGVLDARPYKQVILQILRSKNLADAGLKSARSPHFCEVQS